MRKEKDRSYEVGYGKPPRRNQFKKGPIGKSEGQAATLKERCDSGPRRSLRTGEVIENGRRRRVSKLEVGFNQLANRIAKGDLVAIRLLLTIPGVQKELVELSSSRPLTPEAWERVASLVRAIWIRKRKSGGSARPTTAAGYFRGGQPLEGSTQESALTPTGGPWAATYRKPRPHDSGFIG